MDLISRWLNLHSGEVRPLKEQNPGYSSHARYWAPQCLKPLVKRLVIGSFLVACALSALDARAQIQFTDDTNFALDGFKSETWGASWGDYNGDFWPDLFVGNHRQRPSLYRNNGDGTFTDVILQVDTSKAWLSNRYIDHHGAAFTDINGDGNDELLSSTNGCCPAQLMWSDGMFFTDQAQTRGLANDGAGWSATWLDYNNDGPIDLAAISFNNSALFQNFNDEFFQGATINCSQNNYGQLADLTGDGSLDFICAKEGTYPQRVYDISNGGNPSDVTSQVGTISNTLDTITADFNNDLRTDIFAVRGVILPNQAMAVSSTRAEAALDASPTQGEAGMSFQASGAVTLTVYSRFSSVNIRRGSSASSTNVTPGTEITLDPNNSTWWGLASNRSGQRLYIGYNTSTQTWDIRQLGSSGSFGGWWYIYVVAEAASISDVSSIGQRDVDLPYPVRMQSFRNNAWQNVNWESGFRSNTTPDSLNQLCVSGVAADFDNDMDIDLYLACRNGVENIANRMFENDGSGFFTEVSNGGGAAGAMGAGIENGFGVSETVVAADYNNDGFIDLMVANGLNTQPTRVGGPHQLFKNSGNGNNWIELDLVGTASNPAGVGARVIATAAGTSQLREQNGGYHRWSQNHERIHFGLAANTTVDLSVTWPSGTVDNFTDVAANKLYQLTEGASLSAVSTTAVADFPPPQSGDTCGEPTYLGDLDRGVFVYQTSCGSTTWHLRATPGGAGMTYIGNIASSSNISGVSGFSLESNDSVSGNNSNTVSFSLGVSGGGIDGFSFQTSNSADKCLTISSPVNASIYLGAGHVPASNAINLKDFSSCGAPVPEISVAGVDRSESANNISFTVTLDTASSSTVQVNYVTANGSASSGADYSTVSGTLIYAPGQTSKTVNVPIIDDTLIEGDETVFLNLSNPLGANIATGGASTSATIIDDDMAAGPAFSVNELVVSEADGVVNATVSIQPAPSGPVSVKISTVARTATGGSDFYGFARTLNFDQNTTSQTVAITIVNDSDQESDEYLDLRLFAASAGTEITNAFTPLNIIDDDNGTPLTVSIAPVTVNESDGSADMVISLSNTSAAPVTVNFATRANPATGETASGGSDFYGRFVGNVTFDPGETTQTVAITIVNDTVAEPDEFLTGRIFGVVGATIGTGTAPLTIIDDD